MIPTRKRLIMKPARSPFDNMILREHKTPKLRPILISPKEKHKESHSAGNSRDKIVLPPLIIRNNSSNRIKTNREVFIAQDCNLAAGCFSRIKLCEPTKKTYLEENEISFGDIEERPGGLSELMRKYVSG